ncbi:MAG: ferrous iron transport protein A [Methanomassiliicoccaceae archaeon]|nr:ferrous iron transport protein A [Methanomassiliicoccaceae archaeon]MCL2146042.1 ferrous iron transport protein A [Methanomassiliicoccaceae archaeon]
MDNNCDCDCASSCTCEGKCTGNVCVPMDEDSFRSESGVPLVTARIGEGGKIVRVSGKQEIRKFLCELGFVIGARVSVVNENSGNLILDVKGSRIAMDKAMASKIFFTPSLPETAAQR